MQFLFPESLKTDTEHASRSCFMLHMNTVMKYDDLYVQYTR